MKKVYCDDCEFFKKERFWYIFWRSESCESPNSYSSTYRNHGGLKISPSTKNKDNNCSDIKLKKEITRVKSERMDYMEKGLVFGRLTKQPKQDTALYASLRR